MFHPTLCLTKGLLVLLLLPWEVPEVQDLEQMRPTEVRDFEAIEIGRLEDSVRGKVRPTRRESTF